MDFVCAPPIGVSSADGRKVQIRVMGHHRGQHPRHSIEHTIGDERSNFIRGDGRTGARSLPEHLKDDHLRDVVNLVKLPHESASLLRGLG